MSAQEQLKVFKFRVKYNVDAEDEEQMQQVQQTSARLASTIIQNHYQIKDDDVPFEELINDLRNGKSFVGFIEVQEQLMLIEFLNEIRENINHSFLTVIEGAITVEIYETFENSFVKLVEKSTSFYIFKLIGLVSQMLELKMYNDVFAVLSAAMNRGWVA